MNSLPRCPHCDEPLLEGEAISHIRSSPPLHHECGARMILGSVAHIQHRCSCYVPGSPDSDPPGLTRRQAARAALVAAEQVWPT